MKLYSSLFLVPFLIFGPACCTLFGQTELPLRNPSFESDRTGTNKVPDEWIDCGYGSASSVDIHSTQTRIFDVQSEAADGEQYIGLVAGSDYSWDGLGQVLDAPMKAGIPHYLTMQVKLSQFYVSITSRDARRVNANEPLLLYLWGSDEPGEQEELLAWSPVMNFRNWTELGFRFVPTKSYKCIWFEASYVRPDEDPYDGNVLIDDLSDIHVWTDTVKYLPICMEDHFYGWLDLDLVTDSGLLEIIRDKIGRAAEEGTLSVFTQRNLHQLWLTEYVRERTESVGLRQFVLDHSGQDLIVCRQALQFLGCEEEASILQRAITLHVKAGQDEISSQELVEFDSLDGIWRETEAIGNRQLEFIAAHQSDIISELNDCN